MDIEHELADQDENDRTNLYLRGAVHHDLLRSQRALVEYEIHQARRATHMDTVKHLLKRAGELDAELRALTGQAGSNWLPR